MRRACPIVAAALAGSALLAGCGGMLDPQGTGASEINKLWWLTFWLSLIPLAIVLAAIVRLLVRRRRARDEPLPDPDVSDTDKTDRRVILLGGVLLPIALLIPTAAMTIATAVDREAEGDPLEVKVTAEQFWWDLSYPPPGEDKLGPGAFRTANEVHVPVGRPVELVVESDDVIHSFWVPQLDGKVDAVPGRTNRFVIQADSPGRYRLRCAEFCGLGHALMHGVVVASPPEEFEAWRENEAADAAVELDGPLRDTYGNSCAPCHDLRGEFENETFRGEFGPDLTHLAARSEIGSGVLPNTPQALARWIADPHGVKPGNRMPPVGLDGDEMNEIVDLLGKLK